MNMKKIEFSSIFTELFFLYVFFVWLTDLVLFAGFYTDLSISGTMASVLAACLMLPVLFWFRKSVSAWCPKKYSWAAAAVGLYSLLFFILKAMLPEQSTDVYKYHVLLQEPIWRDMIHENLMPGGMQGFVFPLADRLFYLFRAGLGFRMGTVLNLLCFFLILCQLYRLFTRLGWKNGQKYWPVPAFFIAAQYDVLMQIGSYMVELISVVFLLECVWFLLEDAKSREEMAVFAVLCGCLFTFKVINALYIIPLLLLYLFCNRKMLTVGQFAACFAAGVLPVSIYAIHTWINTGNPVFPYYNTLFHSPYFADANFKDNRWGPKNIRETLLWPLYAVIRPDYRQSELPAPFTWGYGAAWLTAILYGFGCRIRRTRNKSRGFNILGILVTASSLLWSLLSGHSRYYMGGFLLLLLWGTDALRRFLVSVQQLPPVQQKHGLVRRSRSTGKRTASLLLSVLFGALLLPAPLLGIQRCLQGQEWSFRLPLSAHILPGGIMTDFAYAPIYREELRRVGKDRSIGTAAQKTLPQKLLLLDYDSVGTVLFNPRLPVISWCTATDILPGAVYEQAAETLEHDFQSGTKICGLIRQKKGEEPDLLPFYEHRFAPQSIERLERNVFSDQDVYLIQLDIPEAPFNDLTRKQPAAIVGNEETCIGNVQPGERFSLWAAAPGIQETFSSPAAPGIQTAAPENVYSSVPAWLQIKDEDSGKLLAQIPVDLAQKTVYMQEITIPASSSPTRLLAVLCLPDGAEPAFSSARIWVKTSLTGRQEIGTNQYLLDSTGNPLTGWIDENGGTCFANYFGVLQTGWIHKEEGWYNFSENGIMQTGWFHENQKTYYLGKDGIMRTGKHVIDGTEYEFDENGALIQE